MRTKWSPRVDSSEPTQTNAQPPNARPRASLPLAQAMSDFDAGFLVGILVGEGHFGGDARQPQATLRMHTDHAALFAWLTQHAPGGRLYGPYDHSGRRYYQLDGARVPSRRWPASSGSLAQAGAQWACPGTVRAHEDALRAHGQPWAPSKTAKPLRPCRALITLPNGAATTLADFRRGAATAPRTGSAALAAGVHSPARHVRVAEPSDRRRRRRPGVIARNQRPAGLHVGIDLVLVLAVVSAMLLSIEEGLVWVFARTDPESAHAGHASLGATTLCRCSPPAPASSSRASP